MSREVLVPQRRAGATQAPRTGKQNGSRLSSFFLPACFCVRGTPDARCRAQTPPLTSPRLRRSYIDRGSRTKPGAGIRTFPQACPKSGVGWGNRTKSRTGKSSISPSIPRLTETRVGKVGERLGNVTHSPTGLGNSWDSPIFPRPLPHTFPKRIAGWGGGKEHCGHFEHVCPSGVAKYY